MTQPQQQRELPPASSLTLAMPHAFRLQGEEFGWNHQVTWGDTKAPVFEAFFRLAARDPQTKLPLEKAISFHRAPHNSYGDLPIVLRYTFESFVKPPFVFKGIGFCLNGLEDDPNATVTVAWVDVKAPTKQEQSSWWSRLFGSEPLLRDMQIEYGIWPLSVFMEEANSSSSLP